jgi:hypothetical protein
MEQNLIMKFFVRVPKIKNEKKQPIVFAEKALHKRKFTATDMWFLQKNFRKRRPRRIIFN